MVEVEYDTNPTLKCFRIFKFKIAAKIAIIKYWKKKGIWYVYRQSSTKIEVAELEFDIEGMKIKKKLRKTILIVIRISEKSYNLWDNRISHNQNSE